MLKAFRRWRADAPDITQLGGVAPDAAPTNSYISLLLRLRALSTLIRDEDTARRSQALKEYRDTALAAKPQPDAVSHPSYTDRLFPYIHNEFLFNSARKIGPLAQITHLAFAPLYTDRQLHSNSSDPLKQLDEGTYETLCWLWRRAIHDGARGEAENRDDFRGGKDDIFQYVQELVDFSEPYITPKRYINIVKSEARARSSKPAIDETDRYDSYVEKSGFSNIGANTVEFLWRAVAGRKGHFRWARHDRPYQTFTFTNEYARIDNENGPVAPLGSEDWTNDVLAALKNKDGWNSATNPFATTAMHDCPVDAFRDVMGRYVHGANFLILPLKFFLNVPIAHRYAPNAPQAPLLDSLLELYPSAQLDNLPLDKWRAWAAEPTADDLWDREFRALMRIVSEPPENTSRLDALVIGATRQFLIANCFPLSREDRFDSEFVGYKCMGGRAYVFTDIRNRPYRLQGDHEGLFSRSVIIDCGLNQYERGRLIQTVTEFATERIMSLLWLARFRLVHHALNVVQTRLSLALSYYQNKKPQSEETLPTDYTNRVDTLGSRSGPRGLLGSLEFLSSCLSVLNDVVEGGIMDRSHASGHSHGAIVEKLSSIREQPLQGYQSLSEFLERRYARPTRTISRVGERYQTLRKRITETAELVNVKMQAKQSNSQEKSLQNGTLITILAVVLALFALSHPISEVLKGVADKQTGSFYFRGIAISVCLAAATLAGWLIVLSARWFKRWRENKPPP
jgi:hypothetical protein